MTSARGNLRSTFVAAHLRAERSIEHGTTTLRPFVDVGATRSGTGARDETGAGVLDTHVAAHGQTFTTLASGVEGQKELPSWRAGWDHRAIVARAGREMARPPHV